MSRTFVSCGVWTASVPPRPRLTWSPAAGNSDCCVCLKQMGDFPRLTAAWNSPEMHKACLLITGGESSSLTPFIRSLLHIVIQFKAQQRKRDNSIWHLFIPLIKVVKAWLLPERQNILLFCLKFPFLAHQISDYIILNCRWVMGSIGQIPYFHDLRDKRRSLTYGCYFCV